MDSNERPAFGDLLRRARRQAGLTQELLAERAGISVRAITDLERGVNRAPRVDTLELLADALELPAAARAEWERLRRRSAVRATTDRAPVEAVSAVPPSARLPIPLDVLIGRERELTDIRRRLADARLVTLLGPGGIGKTRLAIETARLSSEEFADGTAFVDLAPVRDASGVIPAIATALGVKESAERTLRSGLFAALAEKHLLLVLDNLEQVIGSAGDIGELLLACHNLTILATSRVPLHIQGEQRYPVPELGMPAVDDAVDPERLLESEAVALFFRRAQAIQPDFRVTLDNAPAIAAICVRLDGLPLAIELAAARISVLTPAAMLERLDQRLRLLTGGARDVTQRQRTLRDTIAWSYDLLPDTERQLFRWLAVFSGGWTMEAAEAIAQDNEATTFDVLDSLTALVEHSVVRREQLSTGQVRFGMLEMIREFALEQLTISGDEAAVRQRHAAYVHDLVELLAPLLEGPQQMEALEQLEAEHANIRAALDWCVATGDAERGQMLAGALWHFWQRHGHLSEGRWQLERVLALPQEGVPPAVRALALTGAALLTEEQADDRSEALAEAALAVWDVLPLHEQHSASYAWVVLGLVALRRGDMALLLTSCDEASAHARRVENERAMRFAQFLRVVAVAELGDYEAAERLLEEGYRQAEAAGDLWMIAMTSANLGVIKQFDEDFEQAKPMLEKGIALHRRMGDKTGAVVIALSNLGWNEIWQGNVDVGTDYLVASLAMARELGSDADIGRSLGDLGEAARRSGDLERARALFREGLQRAQSVQALPTIASLLIQVAELYSALGETVHAVRLMAMGDAVRASNGQTRIPTNQREFEQQLALLRKQLPDAAFHDAWDSGHRTSLEEISQEISRL